MDLDQRELNLSAPVLTTGYGVVGYNLALNLTASSLCKVNLDAIGGKLRNDTNLPLFSQMVSDGKKFSHEAPYLKIWHQFDLSQKIGRGTHFAFPIFELDTFSDLEKHHLSYPDCLIVCSQWAKDVILANGIDKPVEVVPLGVDRRVFSDRICRSDEGKTVFLNVGKWEVRKGHDIIADWFSEAFEADENVELWLMPSNPFLNEDEIQGWTSRVMSTKMGRAGKIKILPWQSDHSQVALIMGQADCGLFPSRAEGWNLELLEMMSMGKPVITTNYSAHTEFCDSDNSFLIDCDEVEPAYDGKWFFKQGNWAKLASNQKEQAIQHMRHIERTKRLGESIFNHSGVETSEQYSWINSAGRLSNVVFEVN